MNKEQPWDTGFRCGVGWNDVARRSVLTEHRFFFFSTDNQGNNEAAKNSLKMIITTLRWRSIWVLCVHHWLLIIFMDINSNLFTEHVPCQTCWVVASPEVFHREGQSGPLKIFGWRIKNHDQILGIVLCSCIQDRWKIWQRYSLFFNLMLLIVRMYID